MNYSVMWQRIQTLFFVVATLLVASLFWCNFASEVQADGEIVSYGYKSNKIYLIWIIILLIAQILSAGGYKWRMRQLRVVIFTGILCMGFQGWLVYDYIRNHEQVIYSWTILFPFAAGALDFIGARYILLDEAIVQSARRLRKPRK